MTFDPLTAVFDLGKVAIEKIWPDANKRAEELFKLEQLRQSGDLVKLNAQVQLLLGQIEINKIEATHGSVFVAGWRPAVGWLCVAVLGFSYIFIPVIEWVAYFSGAISIPPPRINAGDLMPILIGMLGMGAMRSADKYNEVQTDRVVK